MKYSYRGMKASDGFHYWINDERGAVATCFVEENARLVVDRMNKGEMAPHLAIALEAILSGGFNLPDVIHREVFDAGELLRKWKQLTKTPPGTE